MRPNRHTVVIVATVLALLAPSVFAWDHHHWDDSDSWGWEPQFRMGLLSAAEFGEQPDGIRDAARSYGEVDETARLAGLYWELLFDKVGVGMRYMGRFDEHTYESSELAAEESWWLDWKGDLYISYHLFEQRSLLDPFVQYGIGTAGRSSLESDGHYEESVDGEIRYVAYDGEDDTDRLASVSLYQYVGGGMALNLSRLQIGAKLNYNLVNQALPGGMYEPNGTNRFEVSLFGGVALGGS